MNHYILFHEFCRSGLQEGIGRWFWLSFIVNRGQVVAGVVMLEIWSSGGMFSSQGLSPELDLGFLIVWWKQPGGLGSSTGLRVKFSESLWKLDGFL
jgi:hypothetical protein